MEKDEIKISGKDNKISINDSEEVEIKGDDNIIKIADSEEVEIKGDDNIIKIDEKRTIKEGAKEIKKSFRKTFGFLAQKRTLNVVFIILFVLILIGSSWIRLQNLPLLVDSTTGENIPLALDPFYFLRVSETMIGGNMPAYDSMRYPSLHLPFTNEFTPRATIGLYSLFSIFDSDISLQFVNIISPVIFFILGLIVFFFLIVSLTKSKTTALISSGFLAIIPLYLYRTMAGFSDHESIGMFSFFLVLLVYTLSIKFLDKKPNPLEKNKKNLIKISLLSILLAFFSAFNIASWGGIAKFSFLIIPLSFFLIWIIKEKNIEGSKNQILGNYLLFYVIWVLFTPIFSMIYGYTIPSTMGQFFSGPNIINAFVFFFLIIDYLLIIKEKKYLKDNLKKYRVFISTGIVLVLGGIFLLLLNKNIFSIIFGFISGMLDPFGNDRIGSTVAENAQPYLNNWMNQVGKFFFWLFYSGMVFVGIAMSSGISRKKHRILFSFTWILMISGILFSKISETSLLNGSNFISKFVYFFGLLIFLVYFIWLYFNEKIEIKSELLIIFAWLFFMLIAGRGAIRFFFLMSPFICFIVGYLTIKLFEYFKKSKDELLKIFLFILLIFVVIILISRAISFTNTVVAQAKYTGPSANYQWQQAMSWIRENTPLDSIFVHWWDYGYWVQYIGQRATITDGGHGNAFWDHLVGRYLLTTPYPETALSFMKAHNISYLLIDPTDIGKYPAYSKIGSDANLNDRYSMIPTFIMDASQTQETSEKEIRIYTSGGGFVDEDIIFKKDGKEIFIPSQKSAVGGIIVELGKNESISFDKVEGVFFYNEEQFRIPLRYVYYKSFLFDTGEGLEALVYFIPSVGSSNTGVKINELGTAMYLSPKVLPSLVSQLYLLNNTFEKYKGVKLVHSEPSPIVDSLLNQGAELGEFIYYSGSLQGPIKIWKISPLENIIARQEFLNTDGEYAEYDNLEFIK